MFYSGSLLEIIIRKVRECPVFMCRFVYQVVEICTQSMLFEKKFELAEHSIREEVKLRFETG